jgi:hypothetical protein
MSSRFAVKQHSATPQKDFAATPVAGVQSAVRVEAAANDDKPRSEFRFFGDPMFGIAIASVILFAILAALMAYS